MADQNHIMKKLLLPVAGFCVFSHGQSQVLDLNSAPVPNSTFIFYDANVPVSPFTFGASGTSNTWDFTGITPVTGADDTVYVKAMSTSAAASAAFPGGSYMDHEADNGSMRVVGIESDGAYVLGAYGDIFGLGGEFAMYFESPALFFEFPTMMGSHPTGNARVNQKMTGAAIGQPSVDSVWVRSRSYGDREIIATGDLVVPAGTFTALLQRAISAKYDTVYVKSAASGGAWVLAPGQPSTERDSNFYWYNQQSLVPYAHALYENGVLHDVNYFRSVTTDTVSGINAWAPKNSWAVYPNPAKGSVNISGLPANSIFEVYDMGGRNVCRLQAVEGQIETGELDKGVYFLQPVTINRHHGGLLLVKE